MTEPVRIVLSMIVRNESRIIRRCLEHANAIVDAFVISDTGSTDTTPELITEYASKARKRCMVARHIWEDFGVNRSIAAAMAREFAIEQGWPLARTYMLLLDADMVLKVSALFNKEGLAAPCYDVWQRSPTLEWKNPRLCRLDLRWEAVEPTHEYWRSDPPLPFGNPVLPTLEIDDRGDGGAKGDKFERDVALLQKRIRQEPMNVRAHFYLAQTLFDLGRYTEAIDEYAIRRALGGWPEEVWYSLYRTGIAELRLGREAAGVRTLLAAFQERPSRAEPLVRLAEHFRARSEHELAELVARRAHRIPKSGDALFVETPAYTYQPIEELSIAGYYTGSREDGRHMAEELVNRKGLPTATHANALRTASFYVEPIAPHALRTGTFVIPEAVLADPSPHLGLDGPNKTVYVPKNPSIARLPGEDSFRVSVNLVNYHHERGVVFHPKDPDGVVRTRNVFFNWAPDSGESAVFEQTHQWPEGWSESPWIRGLEDIRLFEWRGELWFTATTYHADPKGKDPKVVAGFMNRHLGLQKLGLIEYSGARAVEKNWTPWVVGGELRFVYGYDPVVVLTAREKPGGGLVTDEICRSPVTSNWSSWRGGSPVVDGYTFVHVVAHFDDRRVYMHRLVKIGPFGGGEVTQVSRLFVLEHTGVEYVTGLCRADADGQRYIVTFGSEEREAKWMEFPVAFFEELLGEGF